MSGFQQFLDEQEKYKILTEMSLAKEGDWDDGLEEIGNYSEGMEKNWELVDKLLIPKLSKTFEFRRLKSSNTFILGNWHEEVQITKEGQRTKNVFRAIFKISLTKYNNLANKLKYNKLSHVDGVYLLEEYRRNDIALIVYKYLVNNLNYSILGGEKQYFGARRLWSVLSLSVDVNVDLVDIDNFLVIDKNVILHHGKYDEDFDTRLWSYTKDKLHIRSVLTKII